MSEFIKVEFLENVGTYEKGEIREINILNLEDLKGKVKVLEEIAETKKEEKKEIKTAKNKAILKPKNTK